MEVKTKTHEGGIRREKVVVLEFIPPHGLYVIKDDFGSAAD